MPRTLPCHRVRLRVSGTLVLMAGLTVSLPVTASESLVIQHQPVRCLVAGKYPRLDACFDPSARVARARVYFRAEGVGDWYFVEMKAEAPCFRGILPRPKKSLKHVAYYVVVTDQEFAEARTEEYAPVVVPNEASCSEGLVAPFLTSASVVLGGAAAVPAGFVGGGILAGVGTAAVVAGAAVVGGGAAAVVVSQGDDEEPPSTTRPPATTTTTLSPGPTTTTTTTTTTSTTTTTLGGCVTDSAPPDVRISSPADNADVGARIDVVVEANDPGPVSNGIKEVRLSADEQGGSRSASIATLAGPGPTFRASWALPPCLGPQDRWYIEAEAVDGCGRTRRDRVRVKRRQDSCFGPAASTQAGQAPVLVWTSELGVPGGRGQVISNDADVMFPGPGRSDLAVPVRPGRNRVEAVLVERGRPGLWRFTLAAGSIQPGSLRVLAGEAVAAGPATVAFRLRGHPGERVVLVFDVE